MSKAKVKGVLIGFIVAMVACYRKNEHNMFTHDWEFCLIQLL